MISNTEDIIDSRDVIKEIEELEGEIESLKEYADEAITAFLEADADDQDDAAGDRDDALEAVIEWESENLEYLTDLKNLASEGGGCEDWVHGATLINEDYFTDYCKELCEDIGELPRDLPGYIVIDWDATAENLRADYSHADFGGETYLIRS